MQCKIINRDSSIAEASSGEMGVEISTIRRTIGASKGAKIVVVATVDSGVADNEECRDQRGRNSWG